MVVILPWWMVPAVNPEVVGIITGLLMTYLFIVLSVRKQERERKKEDVYAKLMGYDHRLPCERGDANHIPMPNTWDKDKIPFSWKCSMCGMMVTEEGKEI